MAPHWVLARALLLVVCVGCRRDSDDGSETAAAQKASAAGSADEASEVRDEPATGYQPIWYQMKKLRTQYGRKYSGALGTYTAKHRPMAVYDATSDRTFFVYGGEHPQSSDLTVMAGEYDHKTGEVTTPTEVMVHADWRDPHNNPAINLDDQGRIWVFVSGRMRKRKGFRYVSTEPRSVASFDLDATYEFTYPQIWNTAGQGMLLLLTKYTRGREVYWQTSDPAVSQWSKPQKLLGFGGHYTNSVMHDGVLHVAFNYHPDPSGDCRTNCRTNLYYVKTSDHGKTWTTASDEAVVPPVASARSPSLVYDYESEDRLVYLKDISIDAQGRPAVMYVTSTQSEPGPPEAPRKLRIAHRVDDSWVVRDVAEVDHNYDHGSLWTGADAWWVLVPTGPGEHPYHTGGVAQLWKSADEGATWSKQRSLPTTDGHHHNYVRKVEGANAPFVALWSVGDAAKKSETALHMLTAPDGPVYVLPREFTQPRHKLIELAPSP